MKLLCGKPLRSKATWTPNCECITWSLKHSAFCLIPQIPTWGTSPKYYPHFVYKDTEARSRLGKHALLLCQRASSSCSVCHNRVQCLSCVCSAQPSPSKEMPHPSAKGAAVDSSWQTGKCKYCLKDIQIQFLKKEKPNMCCVLTKNCLLGLFCSSLPICDPGSGG